MIERTHAYQKNPGPRGFSTLLRNLTTTPATSSSVLACLSGGGKYAAGAYKGRIWKVKYTVLYFFCTYLERRCTKHFDITYLRIMETATHFTFGGRKYGVGQLSEFGGQLTLRVATHIVGVFPSIPLPPRHLDSTTYE